MNIDNRFYTSEKNVQIVIALLKANGIKKVVASPGTTNMTFVASIQRDPFFEIYSSVDERSAAYIACGLAEESGEPVVISCTGATASRNYMPGLTEAYYRKLPILAITSHRGNNKVGHLFDQQIDRRNIPNDIANISVTIPMVRCEEDEKTCFIDANKAILALKRRGGGPAHINIFTEYSHDFSVKDLPPISPIERFYAHNTFPHIDDYKRIAIFVGSHKKFTQLETKIIEEFCEKNNSVVLCDHTSGYYGKYRIQYPLINSQMGYWSNAEKIDLLIHIGEVSGSYAPRRVGEVWRVSEDGEIRDTFGKLTKVFEVNESTFFNKYCNGDKKETTMFAEWKKEYTNTQNLIPDLPFGNIWIAKHTIPLLPKGCNLHLGILNTLRSWNFFNIDNSITTNCNVGGFGIDGGVSTLIGASLANKDKLYYGIFGDLAFFYDMNVIGNRHIGNNVRILLINNAMGAEFRNFAHPCYPLGEDAEEFLAAAGHYGNKSPELVKNFAQNLGFQYLSATNKEEFIETIGTFTNPSANQQPIILEVFTNRQDESDALETILKLNLPPQQNVLKRKIKTAIRLGKNSINKLIRD